MSNTERLLSEYQSNFDKFGITRDDFDKFNANMLTANRANPAQGGVNKALYAKIAQLEAELAKGGGGGKDSGASEIEKLMQTDYSIYIYVSRATNNITAVNTAPGFTAGQPVALPYVLWGYNDYLANYTASLQRSLVNINLACPGITYTVTASNGVVKFTWTLPSSGKSDIVNVYYAGQNTNYLNLLTNQSQIAGTFYSRYTNYYISDITNGSSQPAQEDLQWVRITSGGAQSANEIILASLKNSYEFLTNYYNLKYPKMHYDATLALVGSIIACPATDVTNGVPFIVGHNMYCDHHESHANRQRR